MSSKKYRWTTHIPVVVCHTVFALLDIMNSFFSNSFGQKKWTKLKFVEIMLYFRQVKL